MPEDTQPPQETPVAEKTDGKKSNVIRRISMTYGVGEEHITMELAASDVNMRKYSPFIVTLMMLLQRHQGDLMRVVPLLSDTPIVGALMGISTLDFDKVSKEVDKHEPVKFDPEVPTSPSVIEVGTAATEAQRTKDGGEGGEGPKESPPPDTAAPLKRRRGRPRKATGFLGAPQGTPSSPPAADSGQLAPGLRAEDHREEALASTPEKPEEPVPKKRAPSVTVDLGKFSGEEGA